MGMISFRPPRGPRMKQFKGSLWINQQMKFTKLHAKRNPNERNKRKDPLQFAFIRNWNITISIIMQPQQTFTSHPIKTIWFYFSVFIHRHILSIGMGAQVLGINGTTCRQQHTNTQWYSLILLWKLILCRRPSSIVYEHVPHCHLPPNQIHSYALVYAHRNAEYKSENQQVKHVCIVYVPAAWPVVFICAGLSVVNVFQLSTV